jgi:uncharacterized repeat protein (TIGR03803 family)
LKLIKILSDERINQNIMKIFFKQTPIMALLLLVAFNTQATALTTLYSFTGGSDGFNPYAGLIFTNGVLYGTTAEYSYNYTYGTVFMLNTNGTGFATLHNFGYNDGSSPYAKLTLSGQTLYGTTIYGGNQGGNGVVFKLNTNGTGYATLYNFTGYADGGNPYAGLILSGNTLYGTTFNGGNEETGNLFKINTNGTSFTVVYSFSALSDYGTFNGTNNDGADPYTSLVLVNNTLYGTTQYGGGNDNGTLFKVNTDGTGFTVLHSFNYSDGSSPYGGLILFSNLLYGTTETGGSSGYGTMFKINTNGTGFTTIHNFINSDGAYPRGSLTLSGNTLYGATYEGGSNGGYGTLFQVNVNGTGFTNLYSFSSGDGSFPNGDLILSGNTLYGTTLGGGTPGDGTVFALALPPPTPIPLNISFAIGRVILSWSNPTFALQAAPAVTGTYTNIPGATSPYTNIITGLQMFFRLQSD